MQTEVNSSKGNEMRVIDTSKLILDYDLIYKLRRFGYSYEYIISCLKDRVVNYTTATYYLLLKDKS